MRPTARNATFASRTKAEKSMTYWGLPVIGCDVHIRKSVQEVKAQHGMRRLSSDVS
jgi:hypothetical protein